MNRASDTRVGLPSPAARAAALQTSDAQRVSLFVCECVCVRGGGVLISPWVKAAGSRQLRRQLVRAPPVPVGWYISEEVLLNAAKGLIDTSRPIKGRPAGSSLLDLGFNQVGMDEGWATCPASKKINPKTGYSHGRDLGV